MHDLLLLSHSFLRWLVFIAWSSATLLSLKGFLSQSAFSPLTNALRHWTTTLAQVQLMIGGTLYFYSPTVSYFWENFSSIELQTDLDFFAWFHPSLMLLATVLLSIGSALTKRQIEEHQKFKTMFFWFGIGLLILFIAIPWPFSPFANRPFLRLP